MVSIIIPVYNAEKYLSKCLDSVINQTYKEIEVILVNDGSTDNSAQICEQYQKVDDRIKVINKKNGGVSSARNSGLEYSNGRYISFIDPDDWIEYDMIERLYSLIGQFNAEISICGYFKEKLDGTIVNKINDSTVIKLSNKDGLNYILNPEGYKGYLWNKLFSADLIKKNNIKFNEEVHFCEDLLFCCESFLKAEKLIYDTNPYYHYILHENNISQTLFNRKKITALYSLEKIIDLLSGECDIHIKSFKNHYMHLNISMLMNGYKSHYTDTDTLNELKRNLFKYKITDLTDKSVKLSCILGRISTHLMFYIWKNKIKMTTSKN